MAVGLAAEPELPRNTFLLLTVLTPFQAVLFRYSVTVFAMNLDTQWNGACCFFLFVWFSSFPGS